MDRPLLILVLLGIATGVFAIEAVKTKSLVAFGLALVAAALFVERL